MRPMVQLYLADALATARARIGLPNDGKLAFFAGQLDALRYVGKLSVVEERDWGNRMLLALGIASPSLVLTDKDARDLDTIPQVDSHRLGQFVRSITVPNVEYELHGGRLRVLRVDVYELIVSVRWQVTPLPDIATAFPEEASQLAHDLEGLDTQVAEALRNTAEERMRDLRLYKFDLVDDVETAYRCMRQRTGGVDNEKSGDSQFSPSPPPTATMLTLTWLDLKVDIPLS